jgi:hypothetical protein
MFEEAREHMPLSHELVTIKTDIPLETTEEEMALDMEWSPAIADIFNKYEFPSLEKYISGVHKKEKTGPQVKLEIEQSYDKSSRKLDITVKGTGVSKAAQVIDDHCMFIYLTEQGLVGQQYSSGAWNNSFEHNNTLRAVLTDVYGDQITWSGDNFTYTTSYTIPADYNADNLSITAFIAPKPSSQIEEMAVNNCERVAVNTSSTGIQTVGVGGDIHEVARYTLDGKQLTAPAKGVNIVRLSDGSIRKVIVK